MARSRSRGSVSIGSAYIQSTFNNTLITLTDTTVNVIAASSAVVVVFKASRKSTAFAAQRAVEDAVSKGRDSGLRQVSVFVQGPGAGREAAIRTLQSAGLQVSSIRDVTPTPHNGCRPRKKRSV